MKLAFAAAHFKVVEEYESDFKTAMFETDGDSEHLIFSKPVVTRSGRPVKVWTRFDLYILKRM